VKPDSPRWREVTPSEFDHEREGLNLVRELLPDRAPYRAWSNFEFKDDSGKWHEVDLLVLGESRLHLVELKHYRGTITGSAYKWTRGGRTEVSPLLLARRKAQRLKSLIVRAAARSAAVPWVQECVFLHAADGRCALPASDATDLFGLDGDEERSGLPGLSVRLLEPANGRGNRTGAGHDEVLAQLFDQIGFAVRREREVGSWRLIGPPEDEGEGWQDWPAEHRVARNPARARFFVSPPGASEANRRATRALVERVHSLTSRLKHENVLSPIDLVDNELGAGLVFPRDETTNRLDLWLDDRASGVPLDTQVGMLRQLAEALAYAHRHHVVHRGLTPAAVQVRERADGDPVVLLADWQVAGADDPEQTADRPAGGGATRIFKILEDKRGEDAEERRAGAYRAPEGRWSPTADRVKLDVFALGAVAYHLIAGRPPAADATELRERLASDGGLDLTADVPEVPDSLRRLVLAATRNKVTERLTDVRAVLAMLDEVERELAAPTIVPDDVDPLEAAPGALLGTRFELLRRLGSGSTAVGLLVADRDADGEHRVLKVALDDAAARRLEDEAAVLRPLRTLSHPRLVRLADEQPLRVGGRLALLLESAGDRTLADVLRERPRLSLDLLERWGTDLLEAVVALDKAGIDHRDVKPANLGIRKQPSDRAPHLVLFDFSLSRAGAASVEAGTVPYLDPFLGSAARPHWDSAAERYAVAVTLHQMATGRPPVFGDGLSQPASIPDEATIDPGSFDPSVSAGLAEFFRRAFRRNAGKRFDTAAEMLDIWQSIFAGTTVPDDADTLAERVQPDTPLAESGLSARALSALEPFRLDTVGDLADVDPGRLSRLGGIAEPTRREVRSRAKRWRERFGDLAEPSSVDVSVEANADLLGDPELAAVTLAERCGPLRAKARRRLARAVLGLDGGPEGGIDGFATLADLAKAVGVATPSQAYGHLTGALDAWAEDQPSRAILDEIRDHVRTSVDGFGGVARAVEIAADLAGSDDPLRARVMSGLIRLALDRADHVERGGGDAVTVHRRRRRRDASVVLAADPALLDTADALGRMADDLVSGVVESTEYVVAATTAAARLRPAWPAGLAAPEDAPLVRLAARLSDTAGASRRGELHDRGMPPATAVKIALGGLAPSQRLTADDIKGRVRARFPDLEPLPGRPRLDRVLVEAGLPLQWDGAAFTTPSVPPDTTLASRSHVSVVPVVGRAVPGTTDEDARLVESASSRSFLALGVPPSGLDAYAGELAARHGAVALNVTSALIEALRGEATLAGIGWDDVRAADAAEPGSRPAQGLTALVRRAAPAVEKQVAELTAATPAGTRPVLLLDAEPLARYGHTDLLARLSDITVRREQAVWLVVPRDGNGGASLDGVPVPLAHGGQFMELNDSWLRATALEGDRA
jgi:serine/threonine protein kinase